MKKWIAIMLSLFFVDDVMARTHTVILTSNDYDLSGSNWKPGIIVTAAHVEGHITNAFCEDKFHDVAFIKTSKIVPENKWRDPVEGEPLVYVGKVFEPIYLGQLREREVTVNGKALENMPADWQNSSRMFYTGTGQVIKGMSGGSVVSRDDGSILGIINGIGVDSNGDRFTLFTPTSVINQVWESCAK